MSGIVKMASGIAAAVGVYRVVVLCMVLSAAWGLHAGWVHALLTGAGPGLWVVRVVVLHAVLVVALWPTASGAADRISMTCCLLVFSGLICLMAHGIVMLVASLAELAV